MTYRISEDSVEKFKLHLEKLGFKFEERQYQQFLARYPGFTVNLFDSGKITFGGKDEQLQREVEWYLEELRAEIIEERIDDFKGLKRIGTDEAGKGDFFGPIVISGVFLNGEEETHLAAEGVRDSKKIRSGKKIFEISEKIRQSISRDNREIVKINPSRYNQLFDELQNMNTIMGWAHARAIENLLDRNPDCKLAIADQFGDRAYIEKALMKKGKQIELVQMHRAEGDLAVAAASILAREQFLRAMDKMNEKYDIEFPRGASKVRDAAIDFCHQYGKKKLKDVAKINFSIAREISDL